VPALLVLLAVVGVYSLLLDDRVDGQRFAVDGLSALGYVANWHFISSGQAYIDQFLQTTVSPLRHMWSLAIEEQFYLVWPLVVIAVAKLSGSRGAPEVRKRQFRRALIALCAVLGVLSFLRMLQIYTPTDINRVYYGTDSRAFIILIGAALAAITWGAPVVARRWRPPLVAVGGVAVVGLFVAVLSLDAESSWLYEGGYGLIALAMVLVLFAAAQPGRNPIARVLEVKPLVGLGLISYGVYLWHWPISLWLDEDGTGLDGIALFALRAAATLAVSIASYKLLEMPIRTGRLRISRGRPLLGPAVVVVAVATLLLVPALAFPTSREVPRVAPPASAVTQTEAGYEGTLRCDGGPTLPPLDRDLLIQVQGNSLAGEIRPCLAGIVGGPQGVEWETTDQPDEQLCKWYDEMAELARETRPDAALFFAFVAPEEFCGDWKAPLDELVKTWTDLGAHVYLVPSPWFIFGTGAEADVGWVPGAEWRHYTDLAAGDPDNITVLDAGRFIRTDKGEYVWRMPCLPGGEPGCDQDGTVGVRYIDGLHFCTDPDFAGHGCIGEHYQAGQRRGAASLAVDLVPSLQQLAAQPSTTGRQP
jgi:peptidoglycan/LPS O-acetylase OafA/YrhL